MSAPAAYIDDGTSLPALELRLPQSLVAAAKGYSLTFKACSGATVSTVTSSQAQRADQHHAVRHHLGRRQRRRVQQRAHRVRAAGLDVGLRRLDQHRPVLHQQHPAGPAEHALRLDQVQGAERRRGRRRLPAGVHGRGLQRRHLLLARRGDPAQRHRRPAQQQGSPPLPAPRASSGPTPRRGSPGTPSATAPSGSTASRTRSARAYHPNRLGHSSGYQPLVSGLLVG
ncbi:hypothetical protein [Nocardioides convexus]|uniref:hypothetical protein n=1 Tax=Nocardioides convexus TaxID=2712224 RepID=UPI0031014004